jgi:SAM-dependent methyltransferase
MEPQARRRILLLSAAATAGVCLLPAPEAQGQSLPETPRLDVPFAPTPQDVVDLMLELAKVGTNDVLYDLGCGDGRIVITAAKVRGARGTGIDLNPQRIADAKENAKHAGVADKVSFEVGDLFEADLSPATVVTLYLLPTVNLKLRPQLWKQLEVGTRVVSHDFDMGPGWPPEQTVRVNRSRLHFWTITEAQKRAAARAG